jgi:hypothetical protein
MKKILLSSLAVLMCLSSSTAFAAEANSGQVSASSSEAVPSPASGGSASSYPPLTASADGKPKVAAHQVRLENGVAELALQVLAPGKTIVAVRIDNLGGLSSHWRSDGKDKADPLAVSHDGRSLSSGAQTMNLAAGKTEVPLSLSLKDNGAFAGKATEFRVTVFFAGGERAMCQMEKAGRSAQAAPVPVPLAEGNSKAFRVTPVEGLTISAPANALDRDRVWKVSPAPDKVYDEYSRYLDEYGGMVAEIYEINAGLSDNERFPGLYTMEFDLDALGIPEGMNNLVHVVRIGSNGRAAKLFSRIEGRKLVCESDQNSLTIVGLGIIGALLYWKGDEVKETVKEALADTKWRGLKEKSRTTVGGTTFYALGQISLPRDEKGLRDWQKKRYLYTFPITKDHPAYSVYEKEVSDMLGEFKKAKADADAYLKSQPFPLNTNRGRDRFLRNILAGVEPGYKDKYKRWRECRDNLTDNNSKWIQDNFLVGAHLDAVLAIEAANTYLSDQLDVSYRPKKTIDVIMLDKIPDSTASALTVNPYTEPPYVQLAKNEFENPKSRDSAFVTTGHELLHVWQAYAVYIDSLGYNSFWEAHARYFEREYTDWLCDTKKLIPTKPSIDGYGKNYEYLAFGAEYMPGYWEVIFGDKKMLNNSSQDYGYTRSRFFHWLEDKKGSSFRLSRLISNFTKTGKFHGATIGSDEHEKIASKDYDAFYVEWCQSIAGDMYNRLADSGEVYKLLNVQPVTAGAKNPKTQINYKKIPHLSSFVQQFKTDEKEYAWILRNTGAEAAMNPYHILGIYESAGFLEGTNKKAAVAHGGGRYYLAGNLDPAAKPKMDTLHAQFTVVQQAEAADLSFDAYLLIKPEAPIVAYDAGGGTVTLPKGSVSLKEGATDGYRIVIEDAKGGKRTVDVPTADIEKPVKIGKDLITGNVAKISVCEYALLAQDVEVVGPGSSQAASVTIEGDRAVEYTLNAADASVKHVFSAVASPEGVYDFHWEFGNGDTMASSRVKSDKITYEYKGAGEWKPTVTLKKDGKILAKDAISIKVTQQAKPSDNTEPPGNTGNISASVKAHLMTSQGRTNQELEHAMIKISGAPITVEVSGGQPGQKFVATAYMDGKYAGTTKAFEKTWSGRLLTPKERRKEIGDSETIKVVIRLEGGRDTLASASVTYTIPVLPPAEKIVKQKKRR